MGEGGFNGKKDGARWVNTDAWSTTIFVTNFPVTISRQGLWETCSLAGQVVDLFIPNRLSAKGKRFAFVRFAKSSDLRSLINKVRSLWVGSYRLFADETRFKRGEGYGIRNSVAGKEPMSSSSVKDIPIRVNRDVKSVSYAQITRGGDRVVRAVNNVKVDGEIFDDALVLKDDLEFSLLVKVREFSLISKVYVFAANEGFADVVFRYLGGMCIEKIRQSVNIKVKDKVYKVNVTELHAWSPSFESINNGDSSSDSEDSVQALDDQEGDMKDLKQNEKETTSDPVKDISNSDPFNIMETIRAIDKERTVHESGSKSLSKPPGFSKVMGKWLIVLGMMWRLMLILINSSVSKKN
ncbi:hypothetical protein SSX86_021336 [Deinandra increscens subsp. villosa]|uniref:RRM domain-containing protein n=1 Tax=Deinandra increscens subsp. villosa TaxID=3103831 RepID=A0AAP0GVQ8_9ASTR